MPPHTQRQYHNIMLTAWFYTCTVMITSSQHQGQKSDKGVTTSSVHHFQTQILLQISNPPSTDPYTWNELKWKISLRATWKCNLGYLLSTVDADPHCTFPSPKWSTRNLQHKLSQTAQQVVDLWTITPGNTYPVIFILYYIESMTELDKGTN